MRCRSLDVLPPYSQSLRLVYKTSYLQQKSEQSWLSVDPLAELMPEWSSYAYTFNNPVNFTDPDGRFPFPGVFFMFGEFEVGAGLGWGANYVSQSGVAYDKAGTTHFITESKIFFDNDLNEGSKNAELIAGASISLTGNVKYNWKKMILFQL